MEGFRESGLGSALAGMRSALLIAVFGVFASGIASAQVVPVPTDQNPDLYVQENVNVTGSRAPFLDSNDELIYNNGQLARQENEPSCGINPLNPLNKLCVFNWYGFSDRPEHGDAWIGFSESIDGRTFKRRPLTGYNAHKNPIGKGFGFDPTMLVFPGGAMATFLVGDRNGNSAMVVQRMMEVNREYGFRHISEERLITIESLGGVHFIDKPDSQILIEPTGGTSPVTMILEEPVDHDNDPVTDPQTEVTREWPNFRIVVSFADFGGSGENVRTWSKYSDDFGITWSNKRQISNTSGIDQGLTIEDKGNDLLYVFRRFDSGEGRASIMGALSKDRAKRIGKVFEITDICNFDMPTSPNAANSNRAAPRSNAFAWLSATDTHWVLAYVDRPRDGLEGLEGNCLTNYIDNPPLDTELFDGVAGTRIMIRTSTDGKNWSDPEPVMPFNLNREPWTANDSTAPPVHFNFMPTLACARGSCNVVYYSTLTESQTYGALAPGAERPWEKTGFVEDFSVRDTAGFEVQWYRRFLDIFSSKIIIHDGGGNDPGTPEVSSYPERVSRYQIDFFDDDGNPGVNDIPFEKEWSPSGILNYGGNSIPFIGDYIALGVEEWRKDNDLWVDNASPVGGAANIIDAINSPSYFAAWTDNRRVRVFYDLDGSPLPYAVPAGTVIAENDEDATGEDLLENPEQVYAAERSNITETGALVIGKSEDDSAKSPDRSDATEQSKITEPGAPFTERATTEKGPDHFLSAYALTAESAEDDNDFVAVNVCTPVTIENATVQTRIKDAEIYGATIEDWTALENSVRLVSPALAKNYLDPAGEVIQRGFVIGAQNIDPDVPKALALVIDNQPPSGRASWRQLPFDPSEFGGAPPVLEEAIWAERLSTEYVTLFVVSEANAPVTVSAYNYDPENDEILDLVSQITVNGLSEAGDLQDPGTTDESVLSFEIHNPFLLEPDWADLEVNALNPNFKNPNFKNPNFKNPNFKNPNFKNTDYMDPNFKNPNFKNPNFKNTTVEATNLQNPNFKNPNFKNDTIADGFVDVTYQVVSQNNTTTATNADFAYGGDELDDLDIEVIAWQADELDSLQNCDPEVAPGVITENKVIAAKSLTQDLDNPNFKNPNFKNLAPADIAEPFQGFVSYPLPPGGKINNTVRIFCERDLSYDPEVAPFLDPPVRPEPGSCEDLIYQTPNPDYDPDPTCDEQDPDPQICEPTLNDGKLQNKLGYNFWAQKANTGETEISNGREQLIKDVVPPAFENVPLPITEEATGPSGAVVTYVDPTASDSSGIGPSGVVCTPGSGSIFAVATTAVTCTATDLADPPNTGSVSFDVTVEDTTPPVLGSAPNVPPVAATSSLGAVVTYTAPTATDLVDDEVSVNCEPPSDSTFPVGSTDVTCTAADDAEPPNTSALMFLVSVVDVSPPVFDGTLPDVTGVEATDANGATVNYTIPTATDDVDGSVSVQCSPDSGTVFAVGDTTVSCTAADHAEPPNTSDAATFVVSVVDTTGPSFTNVPEDFSVDASTPDGAEVTYTAPTATDLVDGDVSVDCSPASGTVFAPGDTTVSCIAADLADPPNTSDPATFVVTVTSFKYGITDIVPSKRNAKTGSSVPVLFAWTVDGVPVHVNGSQVMTVREGSAIDPETQSCTGIDIAQDPGSSGFREKSDSSWQYNFQAVDQSGAQLPATRSGTPYCLTVTLTSAVVPAGQSQSGVVILKQ